MVPRIPFAHMDVLICRKLGKEISGTGMDPAVVGRPINNRPNVGPDVTELGILSLTAKSEGMAMASVWGISSAGGAGCGG